MLLKSKETQEDAALLSFFSSFLPSSLSLRLPRDPATPRPRWQSLFRAGAGSERHASSARVAVMRHFLSPSGGCVMGVEDGTISMVRLTEAS